MDNNQKAIIHHIRRGAELHVNENLTAAVTYPDGKYVAVNYDAVMALIDDAILLETPDGKLQLNLKTLTLAAAV